MGIMETGDGQSHEASQLNARRLRCLPPNFPTQTHCHIDKKAGRAKVFPPKNFSVARSFQLPSPLTSLAGCTREKVEVHGHCNFRADLLSSLTACLLPN